MWKPQRRWPESKGHEDGTCHTILQKISTCTSDHYPMCPYRQILRLLSYLEKISQSHRLHRGPVHSTPPTRPILICSIPPHRTSSVSSPRMNSHNLQTQSHDHDAQASHHLTGAAVSNTGAKTTRDRSTHSRHHREEVMRIRQGELRRLFLPRRHCHIQMPETNGDQVPHRAATSTSATSSSRIPTRTVHRPWSTWRGSPKSAADRPTSFLICSSVFGCGFLSHLVTI